MAPNNPTFQGKPVSDRVQRLLDHTRTRYTFLTKEVDIDPAEIILIAALWVAIFHRIAWEGSASYPDAYEGVLRIVGPGRGELITGSMLFLGVSGILSIMLYLPSIRRTMDTLVGLFFVVMGISAVLVKPDSLLPWIEIFILGGAGIWTSWRQGADNGSGALQRKRTNNSHN